MVRDMVNPGHCSEEGNTDKTERANRRECNINGKKNIASITCNIAVVKFNMKAML